MPLGFEQVIPPSGPAPDLTPDQKYLFSCTGNGTGAAEFRAPDTVTRTAPPLRRRSR